MRPLLLLPTCAGVAVQAWEGLSVSSAFPAALLCAFALAAPSWVSAGLSLYLNGYNHFNGEGGDWKFG